MVYINCLVFDDYFSEVLNDIIIVVLVAQIAQSCTKCNKPKNVCIYS